MVSNKEIRRKARKKLTENYLQLVGAVLVIGAIAIFVSRLFLLTIGYNLVSLFVGGIMFAILGMWLMKYCLTIVRSESIKGRAFQVAKESLLDCFKIRVFYTIGMSIFFQIVHMVIIYLGQISLFGLLVFGFGGPVYWIRTMVALGALFLNFLYGIVLCCVIQDNVSSSNELSILGFVEVFFKAGQVLLRHLRQWIALQISFVVLQIAIAIISTYLTYQSAIPSGIVMLVILGMYLLVALLFFVFTVIPYYLLLIGTLYNEISKADGTIFKSKNIEV